MDLSSVFLYAVPGRTEQQRELLSAVAKNQLTEEQRQQVLQADGILLGKQSYDGERWVRPSNVERTTVVVGDTARFLTKSLAEDIALNMRAHNFRQLDALTDFRALDQFLIRNIGNVAFVVSWLD